MSNLLKLFCINSNHLLIKNISFYIICFCNKKSVLELRNLIALKFLFMKIWFVICFRHDWVIWDEGCCYQPNWLKVEFNKINK